MGGGGGGPDDAEDGGAVGDGPLGEHPRDAAGAGGDLRRHEREAGVAVGGAGGAGVEAEPADPEEGAADEGVEDVVGAELVHAEAAAGAHDEGGGEGRHARAEVDHAAAREVERAGHVEEAVGRPGPVRHHAVDDEVPEEDEDDHAGELHPFRDGAVYDGRRDDGEHALEHHEDGLGDRAVEGVLCSGAYSIGGGLVC